MVSVAQAPAFHELISRTDQDRLPAILVADIGPTVGGDYVHWQDIRFKAPPEGFTVDEWWLGIKWARTHLLHDLPLLSSDGKPFRFALPDAILQSLHRIDQQASGEIAISEEVVNPAVRDRYVRNSLIEEAITSSQLEGAHTTRRVAKEMIQTGRDPRSRDERMILNNFSAMRMVRAWTEEPLTPDRLLELHRVVTDGTLDDPTGAGRYQAPEETRVTVVDPQGRTVFVPPPAEQLPERIDLMCRFANGGGYDGFLHPVLRAILLHFWLAHDHPFEDGNGRTARALFYWSLLSQGYWLTEFLSVSRILRTAPVQYARAFLYTERDERDTTYFALHQLQVLGRAIDDLHKYLQRKMAEVRQTERLLKGAEFNHRQVALLTHALRHPGFDYTFRSHQRSHNVAYQSARTDLLELVDKGLIEALRIGRTYHFRPATDLARRLADTAA